MSLAEDGPTGPPQAGAMALRDAPEPTGAADEARSLTEDLEALIEDGRTYLEAELVYQKTRAAFVAEHAKRALVFGAGAALLGFLALIGLTVGLIIALTPLLSAWGASALVVALLLLGAWVAVRAASRRWNKVMAAIQAQSEPKP